MYIIYHKIIDFNHFYGENTFSCLFRRTKEAFFLNIVSFVYLAIML